MDLKISVDTNKGVHEREENGREKDREQGKEAKEGIRRKEQEEINGRQ